MGGPAIPAAIGSTWNWLSEDGNGFIYGDRKGSSSDLRRAGKNMPDDLPHGWNWGVLDNNEWVLGG
ncbi:hypothetical protein [Nodularia spumigena]|uniref:hypothetical protein n=1 Tax=Nodularia spumigena TaxID=70799 RepID=UPI002B1ED064|nr:hypothetical protein [Nodularia spumigena]MEA5559342.1 hypothetical protein [Nodularia spumigena CH309]